MPFYQIWQELFDSRTLDVYQYRVMNSLYALIELESVLLKTIEGLYVSDHNINACREETLYILKRDTVLVKYSKALLNRLQESIKKMPSSTADKIRLRFQITYAIKKLQPEYLMWLLQELYQSICNGNIVEIEEYANSVGSQCINDGWSAKGLFDMLRYFRTDKPFDVQWSNFTTELLLKRKVVHNVFISVQFKPQKADAQQAALSVAAHVPCRFGSGFFLPALTES